MIYQLNILQLYLKTVDGQIDDYKLEIKECIFFSPASLYKQNQRENMFGQAIILIL
jgi:hypothetical protein